MFALRPVFFGAEESSRQRWTGSSSRRIDRGDQDLYEM